MFEVKKLEERIAPTSGVFLGNDVATDAVNDNLHASDVGNTMDNVSGNSAAHGNSAHASSNSLGNAVFDGGDQ